MTTTAGTRLNPPSGSAARRPRPPRRDAHEPRTHSTVLVGVGVALWTALLGLALMVCVVLIAWISAAHHSNALAPALATAAAAWLLAQHCALSIPGGQLSVVPLGLSWFLGALLVRGGRQAARLSGAGDPRSAVGVTLAVALPYTAAATALTQAVRDAGVHAAPMHALAGALVFSVLCAGYGAGRESGAIAPMTGRLPGWSTALLRSAAAAFVTVMGIAAAGIALALIGHAHRAQELTSSLHPGLPGTVLLGVVSAAYLPNAVAWTASFGAGPGFAVGTGTSVSLFGVHLGAVPALPLLAPLPQTGSAPGVGWLLFVGILAAGVVAGWLFSRRPAPADDGLWWLRFRFPDAGLALAAGVLCGGIVGIASGLSGGALGAGRMSIVGPSGGRVGLSIALEVGLTAAATVVAVAGRTQWLRRPRRPSHTEAVFEELQLDFEAPIATATEGTEPRTP